MTGNLEEQVGVRELLAGLKPEAAEFHWEACCFCGREIRNSAMEPCRVWLERPPEGRERTMLEYFCHERCFTARLANPQMRIIVSEPELADGVIINANQLAADDVAQRRVRCPGCDDKVFQSWPEGWDGHAAHRCAGLAAVSEAERKVEFKRRFAHLFR